MATYFMFGTYTMDAVKGMSPKRTEKAVSLIRAAGGELKAAYALLGKTDLVFIVDFPGNQEAMKASVELAKQLGIGFTTAPAVTVDEFDRLVSS